MFGGGGKVIGGWETSLLLGARVGVAMVVTLPLPVVSGVRLRHLRRRLVRLLLPDCRGPGVSKVRSVVGGRGVRPLLLPPGLPGPPASWGVGGCTG